MKKKLRFNDKPKIFGGKCDDEKEGSLQVFFSDTDETLI